MLEDGRDLAAVPRPLGEHLAEEVLRLRETESYKLQVTGYRLQATQLHLAEEALRLQVLHPRERQLELGGRREHLQRHVVGAADKEGLRREELEGEHA